MNPYTPQLTRPGIKERVAMAWKSLFQWGDWYTSYWYRSGTWNNVNRYYGTNIDYSVSAGELDQSTIIMACIQWIMRAWPEARPRVMRRTGDGDDEQYAHALTELLANPNPYYDGLLLWQATVASYNLTGNAFWLKVRNSMGRPIRLWYEPHHTIRPAWPAPGDPLLESEEGFITHYEIYRDFKWQRIDKRDVVHFRFGIDPRNPRMGLSPLLSALREIYTDNEAANYTATLLKNMGVVGMIVSPKDGGVIDNPLEFKEMLKARIQGDLRGEPSVMESPVDVVIPDTSTKGMSTRELRWIPEERICALLGLPPGVVGLGTGLMRNTFSNLGEGREQAYESNLIPTQMLLGAAITRQLLPDFSNDKQEFMDFDRSEIRVLSEDAMKAAVATARLFDSGIISRAVAKARVGERPEPGDELFYKAGAGAANAPLDDALLMGSNGNGKTNINDLVTIASGN